MQQRNLDLSHLEETPERLCKLTQKASDRVSHRETASECKKKKKKKAKEIPADPEKKQQKPEWQASVDQQYHLFQEVE